MTEAEVTKIMREHLESQFPKVCPNCNRRFATLHEFILVTRPIEPAISYDAELGDWSPSRPLGTATYSNCPCDSTLVLTSEGMPVPALYSLYEWARGETEKRGMTMEQLLTHLRAVIRRQVLGGAQPE